MDNRFLDAFKEFLGSRSSTVERSSTRTAAAGTFLRFFQTIFENTPLWRLKRLVTLSTYRRYINECIYLSIQSKRLFTTSEKVAWFLSFPVLVGKFFSVCGQKISYTYPSFLSEFYLQNLAYLILRVSTVKQNFMTCDASQLWHREAVKWVNCRVLIAVSTGINIVKIAQELPELQLRVNTFLYGWWCS